LASFSHSLGQIATNGQKITIGAVARELPGVTLGMMRFVPAETDP